MKPYEAWNESVQKERTEQQQQAFWADYFDKETAAYRAILTKKTGELNGTHRALAEQFHMTDAEFCGFLDGAMTSFVSPIASLDEVDADSEYALKLDFPLLYHNMLKAKADWLYTLSEWDALLSAEKRREITRAFHAEGIYINPNKRVGRNDPCPCGSGKKYKNCCGKNA